MLTVMIVIISFFILYLRTGSTDNMTLRTLDSTSPSSPGDNINVVVRVRPLQENEKKRRQEMIIQLPGKGQIYVSRSL